MSTKSALNMKNAKTDLLRSSIKSLATRACGLVETVRGSCAIGSSVCDMASERSVDLIIQLIVCLFEWLMSMEFGFVDFGIMCVCVFVELDVFGFCLNNLLRANGKKKKKQNKRRELDL